jgi:hypothetical protein
MKEDRKQFLAYIQLSIERRWVEEILTTAAVTLPGEIGNVYRCSVNGRIPLGSVSPDEGRTCDRKAQQLRSLSAPERTSLGRLCRRQPACTWIGCSHDRISRACSIAAANSRACCSVR